MVLFDVVGGVPTLNDCLDLLRLGTLVIALKPFKFELCATGRKGTLVVLRLEGTFAHVRTQVRDLFLADTLFVKDVSGRASQKLFGCNFNLALPPLDQRQFEHVPAAGIEQVTGQVFHVQALRNDSDPPFFGVSSLLVTVPLYHSMAFSRATSEVASPAFIGSSMITKSPPSPVMAPATEVARRCPPRVVLRSRALDFIGSRCVFGKTRLYQLVIMSLRVSKPNSSERGWA